MEKLIFLINLKTLMQNKKIGILFKYLQILICFKFRFKKKLILNKVLKLIKQNKIKLLNQDNLGFLQIKYNNYILIKFKLLLKYVIKNQ